ncbi:hypothetical protein BH09ACT7_BH09ACT7_51490 [soil metagenome]
MAIFGRKTARQRMKRATQQALSIPTFRTPADCTPFVLGGLWPAELQHVTSETTVLAEHLNRDLQRIASSANEKLRAISEAGLIEPARQAEEARVVNVARAFAVLRVESTVRHLRKEPIGFHPEYLSVGATPDRPTRPVSPTEEHTTVIPQVDHQVPDAAVLRLQSLPASPPPAAVIVELPSCTEQLDTEEAEPEVIAPGLSRSPARPEPVLIESVTEVVVPGPPRESDEHRLRRFVQYVARQEPGLKWAAGQRDDGTAVLVTDLAYGWIPSGIELPVGVVLLEPAHRRGSTAALLGPTVMRAAYIPGDRFGDATEYDVPTSSSDAVRRTEPVDDLGWQLAEATHWRDGLPRMAYTMAKAGAAGTGIAEAELDVLRVHLDTARYQLIAQYPDIEPSVLLNCMLLAATEAIARAEVTAANYHFAWFTALNARSATSWSAET